MKSLFTFTDYRLYLLEFYQFQKLAERHFSYRAMASRLGFKSPNFLKLVIDGDRNLSTEGMEKVAKGLGLNKTETEYFSYLVFFTQAKDPVAKNYYFGLIAGMRSRKTISLLQPDQFEYFSEWYYPAVREIIAGASDPLDYQILSRKLGDAVSVARIKKAVEMIKRLGLIRLDDNGVYAHTAALLNTGNELDSFAIRHYHEQVIGIAQKSLHTVPVPEREYASLTVKISQDGFRSIKKRLHDFRQELLQMAGQDTGAERVYHLNFQFYPLEKTANYES